MFPLIYSYATYEPRENTLPCMHTLVQRFFKRAPPPIHPDAFLHCPASQYSSHLSPFRTCITPISRVFSLDNLRGVLFCVTNA